jgi:hypothetical protein
MGNLNGVSKWVGFVGFVGFVGLAFDTCAGSSFGSFGSCCIFET